MNNCEQCLASYAPYKVGKDEDAGSKWCELSVGKWVTRLFFWKKFIINRPKGVCQFCNPKSIYNAKIRHTTSS